ncbi:F390 synthetase-related protein [Paenibacillus sanguinis]|uniref:F390 synthetase-related protein n=1 Tax=Paenibacillus sanguinis TaxID=225906 RepID=UPI0003794138|nr:F390 synthetase-related protein [Paenibacillus sanguinis]
MKLHQVIYHYLRTKYLEKRFTQINAKLSSGRAVHGHQSSSSPANLNPQPTADQATFLRDRLTRWQEKQVIRHVKWVRQSSPFYRKWWNDLPADDWRSFPIIEKSGMMEHFDELNTVGIRREEALELAARAEQTRDFKPLLSGVTIGLSSGTSGNRGLFVLSAREQAAWSGTVLAKMLPGGLLQQEKIAFFLRANSNLYESVQRGRLQFQYFDMLEPIKRLIQRLEDYRPGIWIAPPSILRLLAEAVVSGRLTTRPHKLISVAEVLDPLDRRYIELALGLSVHQAYQCTEGFLGYTCEHGTLHLNEDLVLVEKEYLDAESRRFVPIITDFSRTSQPIVRYRLNDILTEAAEPCPCGLIYTAIERIEGRCDDILYLPHIVSGQPVPVFPDFVSRAVIGASPNIEHYHVVQTGAEQFTIGLMLRAGRELDATLEAAIRGELGGLCDRLGCKLPKLAFSPYNVVPGLTKLRRVERRWQM